MSDFFFTHTELKRLHELVMGQADEYPSEYGSEAGLLDDGLGEKLAAAVETIERQVAAKSRG